MNRIPSTFPLFPIGLSALMMACSDYGYNSKSMDESAEGYYGGDTGYYSEPEDNMGESDSDFDDGLGSETESDFMSLRPATTNAYVFVITSILIYKFKIIFCFSIGRVKQERKHKSPARASA